jgi:hypothetical protein
MFAKGYKFMRIPDRASSKVNVINFKYGSMEERSRHAQREPQQIIIMTIKIHK